MTDDSKVVRPARPTGLATDDYGDEFAEETNGKAEPGIMDTAQFKRLLDPDADEIATSIDANDSTPRRRQDG